MGLSAGRCILPRDLDLPGRPQSKTGSASYSAVISMSPYLWLVTLGSLITAGPALARTAIARSRPRGEIQIPSGAAIDRMLDSNAVPPPDKQFSPNDAKAIQQMDQRAKRIDQKVMKGICTGC